jgi:outer membrane lipoprotein-sorting protein
MKKRIALILTGCLLVGTFAASGYGQTAREVLDKMIQAQGGRKVLESIKDSTIVGTLEMVQMGFSGTITIYQKEPNKMRMDMDLNVQGMTMTITQAFDGVKGWVTNPQTGSQELTGKQNEDMQRQALGNDSLLNPEKYGIAFAVKGKEKIGDKDYLVLEETYKDGEKITMYLDPATYLVYKTRGKSTDQSGAEIESETIMSDYRKVGEATVAHAMTIYQNGAEFIRMAFTKVTMNPGLDDALFKMK